MKSIKQLLTNASLFSLFFIICFSAAFYFGNQYFPEFAHSSNLPIVNYTDYLHLSAQQVVQIFGLADSASYVKYAQSFLQNGGLISWMTHLWPPGQPMIIAGVIKLFGDSSYPLKMLYLIIGLWSLAFVFVYHSLARIKNPVIKIFIALVPLYLEVFRSWIFGYAILMSEGTSLPLLIIAFCLLITWLREDKQKYLIASACVFALLAYIRGYFEMFGNFILLLTVIYIIYRCIYLKIVTGSLNGLLSKKLRTILIALLVFNLILVPWRIYHRIQDHTFSWQQMGLIWPSFWTPTSYFPTGNIACEVQPDLCKLLYQNDISVGPKLKNSLYLKLTLMTFITHPFVWYGVKLKAFNAFWFGENNGVIGWGDLIKHKTLLLIEGIVILLAGVISVILSGILWRKYLPRETKDLCVFSLGFLAFNVGLFTFFHYEPRYSLDLQLFFVYLPFWLFFGFEKNEVRNVDRKL